MDEDSEKKQMNIVIEMTTLKMVSRVFSAYSTNKVKFSVERCDESVTYIVRVV